MVSRGFVSPRRRHRPGAAQRGQVLLILVLVVPVLFGFVGLAVDGGLANINQRRAQTAADAASLDAAQLIAAPATPAVPPSALVFTTARDIAAANGFPAPLTCSQTLLSTGAQNVFVFSDSCGLGGATGVNRVTVKVPPDAALIDPDSDCAAGGGANAYQCVQVAIQFNYQTQFEKIFGFTHVLVAANASAYNSTQPPTPGSASAPKTPNSVCGPGLGTGKVKGRDESAQMVDNYTGTFHAGAPGENPGQEYGTGTPPHEPNLPAYLPKPATWVGTMATVTGYPTPVILTAPTLLAGRWVWKVAVADEYGLDAYQLAFYFGQGATTTVHYFSQGIWLQQPSNFSTQPPVPNSVGGVTHAGQNIPLQTGQYAQYPNLAAQAVGSQITYSEVRPHSGGASGAGFFNDWQAKNWPDGSTIEVWGNNWTFGPAGGPGSNLAYSGYPGGFSTVTFSIPDTQWLNPSTKLPFGAATPPPISLYLQDGDRCGDEGLYVTPAVLLPPQPNPGPNLLEG